jgi:hypothetical protein
MARALSSSDSLSSCSSSASSSSSSESAIRRFLCADFVAALQDIESTRHVPVWQKPIATETHNINAIGGSLPKRSFLFSALFFGVSARSPVAAQCARSGTCHLSGAARQAG